MGKPLVCMSREATERDVRLAFGHKMMILKLQPKTFNNNIIKLSSMNVLKVVGCSMALCALPLLGQTGGGTELFRDMKAPQHERYHGSVVPFDRGRKDFLVGQ